MEFINVQLKYIYADHQGLRNLEKEINEISVDVSSASKNHVTLYCNIPNSFEPEFRPEKPEDKVEYSLRPGCSYDDFFIKFVSEPTPHLSIRDLSKCKTYHFFTNALKNP
jgi:hypothetical protein